MRRFFFATCVALFGATTAPAANLGIFTDLVIFGDSYSDGGNAAILTGGTVPDPDFFPKGQFTNGDVWATQLMTTPSLDGGTNFAVGGAEAVAEVGDISPSLGLQIGAFLASPPSLGSKPLAAIFIGGNDLGDATDLASGQAIAIESVAAIQAGIAALLSANITDFVIFGLPNLGRLPDVVNTPLATIATLGTIDFNTRLQDMLDALPATADAHYFDTFALFEGLFANPSPLGVTNIEEGCIFSAPDPAQCTGDLGFFFQDDLHATEVVHGAIADAFRAQVVPLPAAGGMMLGGLLLLSVLRRNRRV